MLLALPPSDPSLYEESKTGVVFVAPLHLAHVKVNKSNEEENKRGSSDSDEDSDEQKEMNAKFHDEWEKKRKKKSAKENDTNMLLNNDHYAVLGLEDFGIASTEAQIKGAYRKLALQYHPDKHKRDGKSVDELDENELTADEKIRKEIWLKIQKAYEILMDPEKRKKHDSSLPFDESIPHEEDVTDENFCDVFSEVFNRNATWAKKKPVPQIGTLKTPYKKVEKFYSYWNNFETTRDFSCYDEYDIEEAADGYEKRYMIKENKKIRRKYVSKEIERINELYRLAYRLDPRIKAEKARIQEEKERKMQERREKYLKKLEEEAKERELEELKKQEEERERKMQEMQKQLKLAYRQKLNDLSDLKLKPFHPEYDQYWAEEFQKKLNDDEVKHLVEILTKMGDSQDEFDRVETLIKEANDKAEARKVARQKKDKAKREDQKAQKSNWSKDDYAALAKAVNKFPGGTPDRWKTIATYMGDGFTSKDVITMAKNLAEKGKSVVKGGQEKIIKSKGAEDEIVKTETEDDGWNEADQKLLEEALRKYPKTLPPKERWGKISEAVPGKTPKECLARFKHIAAMLKKKSEK